MEPVKISEIVVKDRKRQVHDIDELVKSIQELGLMTPITINKDKTLISGYHRLEACKKLGYTEILVNMFDLDEIKAELAEIDENLIRNPLTDLELAEQMSRRKKIYEILHPESKRAEKVKSNLKQFTDNENISSSEQKTFTEDTAEKMGKSQRNIQQNIQIASNLSEEVKAKIKNTPIADNKSELLALAKIKDSDKQMKIIEKVKSGEAKNVKTAIKQEEQAEVQKQDEIIIDVEFHEKLKLAYDELEYKHNQVLQENKELKNENDDLKAKIKLLENKPANIQDKNKKELSKIDKSKRISQVLDTDKPDFIVDKERHSITFEGKEFPLPPAHTDYSEASTTLAIAAKNYCEVQLKYKGQ